MPELRGLKRQCSVIVSGRRCTKAPVRGGFTCEAHGGGTPFYKSHARRLLMAMVEPAFAVLIDAMQGDDQELAVKAAIAVLDRAGFGPKATLEVDDKREDLKKMTDAQLLERAHQVMLLAARNVDPDADPNTIEGSVVPFPVQPPGLH